MLSFSATEKVHHRHLIAWKGEVFANGMMTMAGCSCGCHRKLTHFDSISKGETQSLRYERIACGTVPCMIDLQLPVLVCCFSSFCVEWFSQSRVDTYTVYKYHRIRRVLRRLDNSLMWCLSDTVENVRESVVHENHPNVIRRACRCFSWYSLMKVKLLVAEVPLEVLISPAIWYFPSLFPLTSSSEGGAFSVSPSDHWFGCAYSDPILLYLGSELPVLENNSK